MSAKIKYHDEPLGEVRIIPDFLPSPSELAFREESVKVTISLSKKSLQFFKAEAAKHHTQYQRMIRRLLDAYVDAQSESRLEALMEPERAKRLAKLGGTESQLKAAPRRRVGEPRK